MKNNVFLSIFRVSCIFFTAFVLLIYLGVVLSGAGGTYGLFPGVVFALYAFSLVISAANVFFSRSKMNSALKYLIHLIVTLISEALLLSLVNGLRGQTVLVAAVATGILHAAVFSVVASVNKAKQKEEEYESLYGKLK